MMNFLPKLSCQGREPFNGMQRYPVAQVGSGWEEELLRVSQTSMRRRQGCRDSQETRLPYRQVDIANNTRH